MLWLLEYQSVIIITIKNMLMIVIDIEYSCIPVGAFFSGAREARQKSTYHDDASHLHMYTCGKRKRFTTGDKRIVLFFHITTNKLHGQ